jgi:hypothetical protein
MERIINLIKNKNWNDILNFSIALAEDERFSTISLLKSIDIERDIIKKDGAKLTGQEINHFYENRQQIDNCLNYFLITCVRNYDDLKKLETKHEYYTSNPFYSYISTNNFEPLVNFYQLFPPNYLNKVIKDLSKERFRNINFKILWKFYENNWVEFDEDFFVRSLLIIPMFNRNTIDDAEFLNNNRIALEKVFLKLYKYETPILDISKWESKEGFVCKKVCEFWTEVINLLQEKGYVFNRIIISNLLESLLNNWKKPHLDWHVRLIELFSTHK